MISPYLDKPLRSLANAHYDADVIAHPYYGRTGEPRKAWEELSDVAQMAWETFAYDEEIGIC